MEIPWNPNCLEQRNGRLDRHGQSRDVDVYHFVVIAQQVEEAMLGRRRRLQAIPAEVEQEKEVLILIAMFYIMIFKIDHQEEKT